MDELTTLYTLSKPISPSPTLTSLSLTLDLPAGSEIVSSMIELDADAVRRVRL